MCFSCCFDSLQEDVNEKNVIRWQKKTVKTKSFFFYLIKCNKSKTVLKTMTTSTPTSKYNSYINYSNYLCGFNQRIIINTASATTTSATCGNLTAAITVSNQSDVEHSKDQMIDSLPSLRPDLQLNDTGLFTVYHFIKNFIG